MTKNTVNFKNIAMSHRAAIASVFARTAISNCEKKFCSERLSEFCLEMAEELLKGEGSKIVKTDNLAYIDLQFLRDAAFLACHQTDRLPIEVMKFFLDLYQILELAHEEAQKFDLLADLN